MSKNKNNSCCTVEAIVSFDERGQLVIPKDVRKKFNLKPTDKFALISCASGDGGANVCCFTLLKTEDLQSKVREALEPVFTEILDS